MTIAAERNNKERFASIVEGLENHEAQQLQVGKHTAKNSYPPKIQIIFGNVRQNFVFHCQHSNTVHSFGTFNGQKSDKVCTNSVLSWRLFWSILYLSLSCLLTCQWFTCQPSCSSWTWWNVTIITTLIKKSFFWPLLFFVYTRKMIILCLKARRLGSSELWALSSILSICSSFIPDSFFLHLANASPHFFPGCFHIASQRTHERATKAPYLLFIYYYFSTAGRNKKEKKKAIKSPLKTSSCEAKTRKLLQE